MAYTLLNLDKHFAALNEELQDEAKNYYAELGEDYCKQTAEERAEYLADNHVEAMQSYGHQSDTRQVGNWSNIRQDWNNNYGHSTIEPWGDYDEMVKSMDDETISDEDKAKVQQWVEDWYWEAYGTRWLRYNFATELSEEVACQEYERERNGENNEES